MRGYFGIGIINTKSPLNIGTLLRSANIYGAQFVFTVGKRYQLQSSDTLKTQRHIPLFHYETLAQLKSGIPFDCPLIGIEQTDNSVDLSEFKHPERAMYLLGAEDHGLPKSVIEVCHKIVHIDTKTCLNVAVAGSIVMFDRSTKYKAKATAKAA